MFNLKPFANQAEHMIYGQGQNYLGQQANLFQQAWFGTPTWPKLVIVSYRGRALEYTVNGNP